jgi:hypothetical protein
MTAYQYKIGTSADSLVLLSDLGIPAPRHNFVPFSVYKKLGSGRTKGMGWPKDDWYWGFLTGSQRATLKTYVPDAGATIFVSDLMDDGLTYQDYEVQAEWMQEEDRQAGRRLGFTLKLEAMIPVEEE